MTSSKVYLNLFKDFDIFENIIDSVLIIYILNLIIFDNLIFNVETSIFDIK